MESMKRLVILSIPLLFLAAAQAQDLPDGPGKDTFLKVCGSCHDAGVVVTMHNGKDDWQTTVDDMKGRGADASDDDFKTIVKYLAKYQGPEVNVNKAAAKICKPSWRSPTRKRRPSFSTAPPTAISRPMPTCRK